MASTMKAWQYNAIEGTLEKSIILKSSITAPTKVTVAKEKMIIKVISAALNPVDIKLPESSMAKMLVKPPAIPGLDFCGLVVESPDTTFKPGQLVFGAFGRAVQHGTLAEFTAVNPSECALLPEGVKPDDAAAIGTASATAWRSLLPDLDVVKTSTKVFINGGSGGVGTWAIQLARMKGAEVTTTCSTANVELCKSLGASEVLDYKTIDILSALEKKGQVFDLVIDNVGSPANLYEQSHKFLKPKGVFVQIAVQMTLSSLGGILLRNFRPGWCGGGKRSYYFVPAECKREDFERIGGWMKEGKVRAVVDKVYPFEEVPEALGELRKGRTVGKIVVRVGEHEN